MTGGATCLIFQSSSAGRKHLRAHFSCKSDILSPLETLSISFNFIRPQQFTTAFLFSPTTLDQSLLHAAGGDFILKVSHHLDPFPSKDPEVKEILLLSLTCQPSYSSRRQSSVAFILISFSQSSLQRLKPKKTCQTPDCFYSFSLFSRTLPPFLFVLEVGPVTCIMTRDGLYVPGIRPPQLPFGVKKKKFEPG